MSVVFFKQLNNTPALALAVRGWADVEERGLGDGTMSVFASLNAFVAYAENGRDHVPAGVITFDHDLTLNRIWIFQGFVLPEFRGQGLYRRMWNELVLKAIELKVAKIQSSTHVRNIAMREASKKLGRVEDAISMTFDVPSDQ